MLILKKSYCILNLLFPAAILLKSYKRGISIMNFIEENSTFLKICKKGDIAFKYTAQSSLDETYFEWSKTYYSAAEYITSHLFKSNTTPQIIQLDSYFLPLAFLYRHAVELLIKGILIRYKGLNETKKQIKDGFHDISSLILSIKDLLDQSGNKEELNWLYTFSASMSSFDKGSDSFRYPFRISMVRNLDDTETKLYNFKYVFEDRYDINLVSMINQFQLTFFILEAVYNNDSFDTNGKYKKIPTNFLNQGGAYYGKAVIGKTYDGDLSTKYIRGYDEVSNILKTNIEAFFLPICYLKRNNIELQLKNMYLSYSMSDDWNQILDNIYNKKHNIYSLWKQYVKPSLDIVSNQNLYPIDQDCLIEEYLNRIHQFDSDAAHFRYPTDKFLKPFTSKKQYDALNMVNYIDAILNTIDGIDMIVEEYCSNFNITRRFI